MPLAAAALAARRWLTPAQQRSPSAIPAHILNTLSFTLGASETVLIIGTLNFRYGSPSAGLHIGFLLDGVLSGPLASVGANDLLVQMRAEALRLPRCHLERQFQVKGRRRFARVRLLICAGLLLPGHRMEASFSNPRIFVPHYSTF
jgi:hypothetical protein